MSFGLLNLWMLLGLAGLAIPPLIHLWNRRRYQVVNWGAMQFLEISRTTRRRLLIDELLLMLVRMGMIAALVLGLAGPQFFSPLPTDFAGRPSRAVVVLIDGSASMACGNPAELSPHEVARDKAQHLLNTLYPNDSVALFQVKQQVQPLVGTLSRDLAMTHRQLQTLAAPAGDSRWPEAVRFAQELLQKSPAARRDIVIVTDGQRHGWADAGTLARWEKYAPSLAGASITVVQVAARRPASPPNYGLAPIQATPAVVWPGRAITFQTTLTVTGAHGFQAPHRLRLEIDGQPVRDLPLPLTEAVQGQVPLTFTHRFHKTGSHLVSVRVEPDLPAEMRPPQYVLKDWVPADNRQDVAVEVVEALPVVLVEAEAKPSPRGSTFYWHRALAELRDPKRPSPVLPRVVPLAQFTPDTLTRPLDAARSNSSPRVLVLADVPRLNDVQQLAVERFLQDGGGVVVVLGPRVEEQRAFYNSELFRGGQGWLPARLEKVAGERTRPEAAAAVETTQLQHPALALFRALPQGDLGDARFPCWWRVSPLGGGVTVARLTNGDPWLVEKSYKNGRVMLWSVPTDAGWDGNLPKLSAFSVLAHELLFYLAGDRTTQPTPGQPLRFRIAGDPFTLPKLQLPGLARDGAIAAVLEGRFGTAGLLAKEVVAVLQRPGDSTKIEQRTVSRAENTASLTVRVHVQLNDGERGPLHLKAWPLGDPNTLLPLERISLYYEEAYDPGVYTWRGADGRHVYAVVPLDPRELDLSPCSEADRRRVAELVPVRYREELLATDSGEVQTRQVDLWWLCLLGVLLLLCMELWLTRRLAFKQTNTP